MRKNYKIPDCRLINSQNEGQFRQYRSKSALSAGEQIKWALDLNISSQYRCKYAINTKFKILIISNRKISRREFFQFMAFLR